MLGKNKALTVMQKNFVDNYILSGNGMQAAISAGYSKKSAASIANENLNKENVKEYYQERLKALDLQTMMQQKEVLQRLTAIGRREETETIVVTTMKKIEKWENVGTPEKPVFKKITETVEEPQQVEIPAKLSDTNRALELLGKHHRLFIDKFEVSEVGVTIVNDIPVEDDGGAD